MQCSACIIFLAVLDKYFTSASEEWHNEDVLQNITNEWPAFTCCYALIKDPPSQPKEWHVVFFFICADFNYLKLLPYKM